MRATYLFGALLLLTAPLLTREGAAFMVKLPPAAQAAAVLPAVPGLDVHAVQADRASRQLRLEGITLHRSGRALRIGRLTVQWAPALRDTRHQAAMPIAAESPTAPQIDAISVDDIKIETEDLKVTINHIELAGTRLTKSDLLGLFDTRAPSAAERLVQLTAAHIAIPEIKIEHKATAAASPKPQAQDNAAPQADKLTLSDLAFDHVVKGVAARIAITSTSATFQSVDAGEMQVALGPTQLAGFDLTQAIRLIFAGSGAAAKQPLCDSVTIEGVKINTPQTQAAFGLASVSIKGIAAGGSAAVAAAPKSISPGPAVAHAATDFDLGTLDFIDLRFSASNGTTAWAGRIAHGNLIQIISGKVGQAQLENVSVTAQGATVTVGKLGWNGTLPVKASGSTASQTANPQKLTADTLDLVLPQAAAPSAVPSHLHMAHFELTSSDPVDGVPSRLRTAFDHFVFDLAAVKQGKLAQIATLGYGKLDLSSHIDAHFDNAGHAFTLDAASFSETDMGMVQMSAHFDQVTKGLFSSEPADLEAALVRVLLRHFEIKIENRGLFQHLVATAAKNAGLTDAQIRKEFTDAVAREVPAALDHAPGSEELVKALTTFIADPKTLRLAVTAPDGIGALDVVLSKDPLSLMQKLQIEAVADE